MNIKKINSVVVFFHPGAEHNVKSGTTWNSGSHKRKFMRLNGSYINKSNELKNGDVYFWGEWEAQSKLIEENLNTGSNFPENLFSPYYKLRNIGKCNTDPFVFGNQFYYCICKQGHYTSLRGLNELDIILFGSHKGNAFVLDTLFVVKKHTTYSVNNFDKLKELTNETYFNISIAPIFREESVESVNTQEIEKGCHTPVDKDLDESDSSSYLRTKEVAKYNNYEAVMYFDKDDYNGIYSFVPCSFDGAFARPAISLKNIITSSQNQGLKISHEVEAVNVWEEVKTQVLNQGLHLMVTNDLPGENEA